MSDLEEDMELLRDYVSTMLNSGYDAIELEEVEKKFSRMDCVKLLRKLGCDVIEDLVLLRLTKSDGYYDDEYSYE